MLRSRSVLVAVSRAHGSSVAFPAGAPLLSSESATQSGGGSEHSGHLARCAAPAQRATALHRRGPERWIQSARVSYAQPSVRSFSTSAAAAFSASPASSGAEGSKTIRHPEHPTGIYFHLQPELGSASSDWKDAQSGAEGQKTTTWAISLLEQPPSSADAASIIGFVRAASGSSSTGPPSGHVEGDGGAQAAGTDPVTFSHAHPDAFFPNPAFLDLLHQTLRDECVEEDELLRFEAQTRGSGWAHLNDQRELLMPGRQAWPDNIIASVAFVDGVLQVRSGGGDDGSEQKSTYQPNDAYRLLTAQHGFIQLKETWLDKVRKRCAEKN
ncbi:hypothetical protein OC834_000974 [Tilletia horrida]|nr:hypothetical protein OC834_000974 [Tilletia horrida]